ncbi:uncharacterized protein LOC100179008 [Ciona intestinalis]
MAVSIENHRQLRKRPERTKLNYSRRRAVEEKQDVGNTANSLQESSNCRHNPQPEDATESRILKQSNTTVTNLRKSSNRRNKVLKVEKPSSSRQNEKNGVTTKLKKVDSDASMLPSKANKNPIDSGAPIECQRKSKRLKKISLKELIQQEKSKCSSAMGQAVPDDPLFTEKIVGGAFSSERQDSVTSEYHFEDNMENRPHVLHQTMRNRDLKIKKTTTIRKDISDNVVKAPENNLVEFERFLQPSCSNKPTSRKAYRNPTPTVQDWLNCENNSQQEDAILVNPLSRNSNCGLKNRGGGKKENEQKTSIGRKNRKIDLTTQENRRNFKTVGSDTSTPNTSRISQSSLSDDPLKAPEEDLFGFDSFEPIHPDKTPLTNIDFGSPIECQRKSDEMPAKKTLKKVTLKGLFCQEKSKCESAVGRSIPEDQLLSRKKSGRTIPSKRQSPVTSKNNFDLEALSDDNMENRPPVLQQTRRKRDLKIKNPTIDKQTKNVKKKKREMDKENEKEREKKLPYIPELDWEGINNHQLVIE